MHYIGDTKYGRLIGTDKLGNKYFENMEELPRTSPRTQLVPTERRIGRTKMGAQSGCH